MLHRDTLSNWVELRNSTMNKNKDYDWDEIFKLDFWREAVEKNQAGKSQGRMSLGMKWGTQKYVWMSQGNRC